MTEQAMKRTEPMTQTVAMPRDMQSVSVETLKRVMQEISMLPKLDQGIVIDPQGRMYKGKVEEVAQVLLAEHPLLKMPPMTYHEPIECQERNIND